MGALPNAVVKRLLSEHGGGLRVSGTALERAVAAAENYISRLAAEASASATAAKRARRPSGCGASAAPDPLPPPSQRPDVPPGAFRPLPG